VSFLKAVNHKTNCFVNIDIKLLS